jgi:Tfp pilus assembly protein PilX
MLALNTRCGFVLPVVLGIVLIAALIAMQATTESGSATLLATQRQLHQRAFEAAESGIVAVLQQLDAGAPPAPLQSLKSENNAADSTTVQTTVTARVNAPAGFSADRIVETRYEIRSTGRSTRGARVTVVQGARQLQTRRAPRGAP